MIASYPAMCLKRARQKQLRLGLPRAGQDLLRRPHLYDHPIDHNRALDILAMRAPQLSIVTVAEESQHPAIAK